MLIRPDHDISTSERNEFSHDFELTEAERVGGIEGGIMSTRTRIRKRVE
jgi:hypothetical protein